MTNCIPLLAGVILLSFVGSFVYLRIASKHGPYAIPNYRSLHRKVTPKGGGIIVAISALSGFAALYGREGLSVKYVMVLFFGGILVALAGFADDRFDIPARYRLAVQLAAALWICFWFRGLPPLDLGVARVNLGMVGHVILIVSLLWFYNLYNFIDGIDGMASSATIFTSLTMGFVMLSQKQHTLALILWLLAAANIGFIVFNWPPAKMFLGDSGTSFVSYIFSAVLLVSLWNNAVSIWVWLIVFGCYLADTTTTTVTRALTVSQWYLPHRSHAYQNLARIWNNHLKVLLVVLSIDICWLLPLTLVALKYSDYAVIATLIAYVPLVMFSVKYGPLFENK